MKKQFLLILGLMFTTTFFAAPVTKDSAKKNVLSFLQSKKGNRKFAVTGQKPASVTSVDYTASDEAFFIFNIGDNQGFVIAASDDRVETILGYSNEGSFDPQNVPENMRYWLKSYSDQINYIKHNDITVVKRMFSDGSKQNYRHTVEPMLTTKWNQTSPYNKLCPKFPGDVKNRPTGCVATAMAQVLNYHKWPKDQIASIPEYTFFDTPDYGGDQTYKTMPALPATTFQWDLMLDEYNYNSSSENKEEVAKLMLYCGQSLHMAYSPLASGAFTFDIPKALTDCFGYDKGAYFIDKDGMNNSDWEDIIYNEIVNNRPVLYSGATEGAGGHQFVCDGYENEYFHFNWGWGGQSDGYFKLTCLDPVQDNVVGGNGLNFSQSQQVVIGVQPPVEGSNVPVNNINLGKMNLTSHLKGDFVKDSNGNVTLSIHSQFGINSNLDLNILLGFGLYDSSNNLIDVYGKNYVQLITGGHLKDKSFDARITILGNAILNDGTYYLKIVTPDNGEYKPVKGADKVYFELRVQGNDVFVVPFPTYQVKFTNLHFANTVFSNCESKLEADIENLGQGFDSRLYLTVNGEVDKKYFVDLYMNKNDKQHVILPFKVSKSGEQAIGFALNGFMKPEELKTNVIESVTRGASLVFNPQKDITSEGDFIEIPVEITNNATSDYIAPVIGVLYQKSGRSYIELSSVSVPVNVSSANKTTVNVRFEGLDFNNIYHVAFKYYVYGRTQYYGGTDANGVPLEVFSKYRTPDALTYYDDNGTKNYKVIAEGETFEIPANTCYVEVPKTITNRTIKLSENPNCIYKIIPGVSTSMFQNHNIVLGSVCSPLNLSDSYPFLTPESVLARDAYVSYKVDAGISAVYLPFEPQTVTCDEKQLKRAHSVAELADADFALVPVVAEDQDAVYCDFDDSFKAVPSILVVNKELLGKTIVFSAQNVTIDSSKMKLKGHYYNIFASTNFAQYTDPIYGFGTTCFTRSNNTVKPFTFYLVSSNPSAKQSVSIVYPDGLLETGIEEVNSDTADKLVSVYTIDGVKVKTTHYGDNMLEGLPSGLYIINGKKYVK